MATSYLCMWKGSKMAKFQKGETSASKRIEQAEKKESIENKFEQLKLANAANYAIFELCKESQLTLKDLQEWENPHLKIIRFSYNTLKNHDSFTQIKQELANYNKLIYQTSSIIQNEKMKNQNPTASQGLSKLELIEKVKILGEENNQWLQNCILLHRMYCDLKRLVPEEIQGKINYQNSLARHAKAMERSGLSLVVNNGND